MATAPAPRADLPALTGIRGVAAWFVVLYHVRLGAAWALPPPAVAILGKGYLAVDLFFMLSGFVLWLNYADRLRPGGIGEAATFIARRIARIWPLHLFMLAGAVAFVLAVAAAGRPASDHYPWGELPLHLALMQNWGLTDALTWNDPAWSISCEFAAYLLFPLLTLATDWRRFGTAALCALLVLLAVTLCALMWAGGATSLGADIPHFGLPRALIEFTMGTIVCTVWRRCPERAARFRHGTGRARGLAGRVVGGRPRDAGGPAGLRRAAANHRADRGEPAQPACLAPDPLSR